MIVPSVQLTILHELRSSATPELKNWVVGYPNEKYSHTSQDDHLVASDSP